MPDDPLLALRRHFPILDTTNYLISNSLGAMPAEVESGLGDYVRTWASRGVRAWEETWWTLAADVGDLVAPLIGAREGEVVFQPSVTIAHAVIFSALAIRSRRSKVVTDAMHFPSVLYLIDGLKSQGAEVEVVGTDDGLSIDTQRLLEAIDESTAFVNISHVLFKSAFIHDVKAIAARAREVGALTVVDGYQSVGTIPVDVRDLGVDVYIGGCLKWLCGGPGNAFLWVDPSLRNTLSPRLTGWMSHQRPFAFEPTLDRRHDAWRFLNGTPSIPALHAARPGLELVREAGIGAIRAKSLHQTGRLMAMADERGWSCSTPREPSRRGGTVALDLDHGYEISRALKSREILCDYRPGAGIRLSPHFYTTDAELEAAVLAIAEIQRDGSWQRYSSSRSVVT